MWWVSLATVLEGCINSNSFPHNSVQGPCIELPSNLYLHNFSQCLDYVLVDTSFLGERGFLFLYLSSHKLSGGREKEEDHGYSFVASFLFGNRNKKQCSEKKMTWSSVLTTVKEEQDDLHLGIWKEKLPYRKGTGLGKWSASFIAIFNHLTFVLEVTSHNMTSQSDITSSLSSTFAKLCPHQALASKYLQVFPELELATLVVILIYNHVTIQHKSDNLLIEHNSQSRMKITQPPQCVIWSLGLWEYKTQTGEWNSEQRLRATNHKENRLYKVQASKQTLYIVLKKGNYNACTPELSSQITTLMQLNTSSRTPSAIKWGTLHIKS